ncbi:glycosyltransferase [Acetobacter orientalis]|uniref:glycosyltransferase n=1 Tax=Acetobacter orientalis TaxID=146474 RepID=UPI00211AC01A|nr:glycosyltransferase [Acetobacter orientalis]
MTENTTKIEELSERLKQAEALLESYRNTSALHGMRVEASAYEVNRLRNLLWTWERSGFSKLGRIIRGIWLLLHGELRNGLTLREYIKRAKTVYKRDGFYTFILRVPKELNISKIFIKTKKNKLNPPLLDVYKLPIKPSSTRKLHPKVVIIADIMLPQCAKYRVWQKKEELEILGWSVEVIDWYDPQSAISALQTAWEVILYRVTLSETIKVILEEARRLRLSPWWEVDDLIFDASLYRQNSNLHSLSKSERSHLLNNAGLYAECLQLCDRGIASTSALANIMKQIGISEVCVIENGLDSKTLQIGENILSRKQKQKKCNDIIIAYGSGTRTHDHDFLECSSGLLLAMKEEPRLKLRIIGELTLTKEFDTLTERVEYLEGRDYAGYMELLADADITIAPLEPTVFNDAKSNIKFLEAAILKVPAICSPRDAFKTIIRNGHNGYLAENAMEWKEAFLKLARNPQLRQLITANAHAEVLSYYTTDIIAHTQVAKIFKYPSLQKSNKLKVLAANIFFSPYSFGGATLVAEEIAKNLSDRNTEVAIFTSHPPEKTKYSAPLRYNENDNNIMSSSLSPHIDSVSALDNPLVKSQFVDFVKAFQPDIVHFHSIQGLGIGMLQACVELNIPYVITLHDAWWLCERQFMVKPNGKYCFQKNIDLNICRGCCPIGTKHLEMRREILKSALNAAALLLSPSESHKQLYLANGFSEEKIYINKNGFSWPTQPRRQRPVGSKLRFGFVGGNGAIKGLPLIREAFEALKYDDWELILIDNTLNLGYSSMTIADWNVKGKISFQPAYTNTTRDDFFNDIDILLFPSQWMESYGLTVREALARDVWVISTSPGAQADDIMDGVNGTLIPIDGRSQSLLAALNTLFKKKSMFENYVNPLKSTLTNFETQTKELEYLFRGIVKRHNRNKNI